MKTNETDSKLENLDEARKRKTENVNTQMDTFKFSDSDSDIQPSSPKRKSRVKEYNNQVLDELIEENVFIESKNSEEEEENLYIFNFSITDIYKKKEISCNENSLFNVLAFCSIWWLQVWIWTQKDHILWYRA